MECGQRCEGRSGLLAPHHPQGVVTNQCEKVCWNCVIGGSWLFDWRQRESWRRQWHPTPVLLPGNPMDGGAWKAAVHGVAEGWIQLSNFTFTFHFHALEKDGNPLQCSCLENPRDRGAWWASVYGVTQSWTRLK